MRWIHSFISLLFPRCCVVCGNILVEGEKYLCTHCNIDMPRTHYDTSPGNPAEQMFWGKVPVERVTSYFFYNKSSNFRFLLYQLKYHGCKELGEAMGQMMARELLRSGFFEAIDCIIPVPLHKKKQQLRGYNQSEWIARGISAATGIPTDTTTVVRRKNTETQTRKTMWERWENVDGIFLLLQPALFANKHVLIVDDVLTTGATTVACASVFREVEGIKISVLTLAMAE